MSLLPYDPQTPSELTKLRRDFRFFIEDLALIGLSFVQGVFSLLRSKPIQTLLGMASVFVLFGLLTLLMVY